MGQNAVVGQQQQTLGLLVQPAHRRHSLFFPLLRQQVHHGPVPGILRGGHIACRLVHQQNHSAPPLHGLTVERHGCGPLVELCRAVRDHQAVDPNRSGPEQGLQLPPGGAARVGEIFVQSLHGYLE